MRINKAKEWIKVAGDCVKQLNGPGAIKALNAALYELDRVTDCKVRLAQARAEEREQARGFRDAWKAAAKRWRSRALQHEMDAAIAEGEAQFERLQRKQTQATLGQWRAEARECRARIAERESYTDHT